MNINKILSMFLFISLFLLNQQSFAVGQQRKFSAQTIRRYIDHLHAYGFTLFSKQDSRGVNGIIISGSDSDSDEIIQARYLLFKNLPKGEERDRERHLIARLANQTQFNNTLEKYDSGTLTVFAESLESLMNEQPDSWSAYDQETLGSILTHVTIPIDTVVEAVEAKIADKFGNKSLSIKY